MTDHAARGDLALKDGKPEEAISHFTTALAQNPSAATWLIKRSTAFVRSSRYQDALLDADNAVIAATKRANRELIADAQLRRAISLFKLERYGDAESILAVAEKLNPKEKSLAMWKAQVSLVMKKLAPDDRRRHVEISEVPAAPVAGSPPTPNEPAPTTIVQTPAKQIRHDWYQTNETITFTLLAKGVPKESAEVEITDRSLAISFPVGPDSAFNYRLDPLFAAIDPSASNYRILSSKIEVSMKKANPGTKWPSIELPSTDAASKSAGSGPQEGKGPGYPTSSRSGPKNWDEIAKSFNKGGDAATGDSQKDVPKENEDTADEVFLDDDADDVSDPANHFFQKLFKNSDPDTQRAMMKSYQESGGTALNTNWDQVKAGRVPVTPPSGMEERKWEH